mmetsp:Transcript_2923/g.11137  ORF Transcript_2923/g.11137 Transcript_2923/m.11137 type:complete len:1960 (-) Transcript_2923:2342-8221(-)|eukprot:CAMPEP_0117438406 /NCGR_PEP_ID=MMETSP0759-20121206/2037_1 /TAXON_ID=63605 /ORGANISM="Percolomonas cosmopolitus, Strain WS" /LENGTH=1959 /DNA_ID=CAMNT_0005230097 /DNA_START=271 /DNA_END=6150 /DNA_ORIENTATION=+
MSEALLLLNQISPNLSGGVGDAAVLGNNSAHRSTAPPHDSFPYDHVSSIINNHDPPIYSLYQSLSNGKDLSYPVNQKKSNGHHSASVSSVEMKGNVQLPNGNHPTHHPSMLSSKIDQIVTFTPEQIYYWVIFTHHTDVAHSDSAVSLNSRQLVENLVAEFESMASEKKIAFLLGLYKAVEMLLEKYSQPLQDLNSQRMDGDSSRTPNFLFQDAKRTEYWDFLMQHLLDLLKWASTQTAEEPDFMRVLIILLMRINSVLIRGAAEGNQAISNGYHTTLGTVLPNGGSTTTVSANGATTSLSTPQIIEKLISFAMSNLRVGQVATWVESHKLNATLTKFIIESFRLAQNCARLVPSYDFEIINSLSSFLNEISLKKKEQKVRSILQLIQIECISAISSVALHSRMLQYLDLALKRLMEYMDANIFLNANHPVIECLTLAISEILSVDFDEHDTQLTTQVINNIAQDIFVDVAVERYRHRCVLLGSIAYIINDTGVTQHVTTVLIQVLTRAKSNKVFDPTINRQLVRVALLNHGDTFQQIVDELFTFYIEPHDSQIDNLPSTFGEVLFSLASNTDNSELIDILLNKTLDLFNRLGKVYTSKEKNSHNTTEEQSTPSSKFSSSHFLGVLLAPIAYLLKAAHVNTLRPNPELHYKFKSLWFVVIIFGLNMRWKNELTLISQQAPILADVGCKTNFEGLKSHIESFSLDNHLTLQQQLTQIVKSTNAFIPSTHLDYARTVYLLGVYHLESFRVQSSGSLRHLVLYFEDQSFDNNAEMKTCLRTIADIILQKWLSYQRHEFKANKIEEQVVALFSQLCNRSAEVRRAAEAYLEQIRTKFSFTMWSPVCMSAYLDMLRIADEGLQKGQTIDLLQVNLPDKVVGSSYLPQDFDERKTIFLIVREIVTNWMMQALQFAPNAFKAALEEYVLRYQHTFDGSLKNYGETFALLFSTPADQLISVDIGSEYRPKDFRHGLFLTAEPRNYSVAQSAAIKSYHYGQAKSLRKFSTDKKSLETQLLNHLISSMKKYKRTGTQDNLTHFNDSIQLATAYLITSRHLPLAILQWIIWAPVTCFTPQAMETGIFCWHWICTSRAGDSSESGLLHEMLQAWDWIIEEKRGLFCAVEAQRTALDLSIDPQKAYAPEELKNAFETHRLWINFLSERYQIAHKLENLQSQVILSKMVLRALKDVHLLSSHKNSLGCRLRLCFLALIIALRSSDAVLACTLRQRCYDTLLDWFGLNPTWYEPTHHEEFREDVRVIEELLEKLEEERHVTQQNEAFNESQLFDPTARGVLENNVEARKAQLSSQYQASVAPHTSATRPLQTSRLSILMDSVNSLASGASQAHMYPCGSAQKTDLLLLLLRHELQRLLVFHNPRNDKAGGLPFQPYVNPRFLRPAQWERYINSAWEFNPRVAIQCCNRFSSDVLTRIVTRKLMIDPERAIDIPEAVTLLVTREHVRQDKTQLSFLSEWAPSTMTVAVRLLNHPYVSNDHVRQYALRTLRQYPPKFTIFYMAQLVQCLRHDSTHELRQFLLDMGKQSAIFTHRLIWTLRTEIVNKKELDREELKEIKPAEYKISEICVPFEKEVLASLDDQGKALYEEEFNFFQKMTDISGQLVQFEKGSVMRKDKLVEFLGKVRESGQITKHLYLPSNTESRIVDFDPQGARVLKSSKKVPIMVPFHVKTSLARDISEEDIFDDSLPRKQLCIFKMGDDCRQDELALQMIKMFQTIFKRVGLPLYLFPYRVITTGRGTGIIEVVPNTRSRHDIGALTEGSLYEYFISEFGHITSPELQNARKRFIESMAAYSVVSYILNIKDRHNGNILIDKEGHIIHIDFGFLFDTAPGGKFSIEKSAFKLNTEMLRIMGENPNAHKRNSEGFLMFRDLVLKGFLAAREYMDDIISIVEVMLQSELPCFVKGDQCIKNLKFRFAAGKSEEEAVSFMTERINKAYQSMFSYAYDYFQQVVEGVNM